MKIKDIFAKSIDRDIKGVVKVGQTTDDIKQQELEEYVVTKELQKHFAAFFSAYQAGISGQTDNMGVWIDGFFGSGKSHFLKILSYLLGNDTVSGKKAIDYFKDDKKIDDPFVLGQIENAVQVPTDVILFNIDSKAGSNAGSDKDAILRVFLNVFNEMQGYSTISPYIADLEKGLDEADLFDDFKQKFAELTRAEGHEMDWKTGVFHYKLKTDTIRRALVEIHYLNEGNAKGYIDSLSTPYQINIEQFAQRVNDYIQKKGDNRHVVFLVDEVGQFIGSDVHRMLNLQTIVEELGSKAHGKAWVVVTSQQAIDEVVDGNINGQDFSKIQGRFKTRISMSSADVDEVIKKRILAKNAQSERRLEEIYSSEQHNINNKIDFEAGIQRQKYDSQESFAENYPFVPYQFHLLQDVLNAIRIHGSDGKHLSEGERSMLATFQEAAKNYENQGVRSLVPFSLFFEGLAQFLDHNHKLVIERAEEDKTVNPQQENNPFAVQVLKTLFMVKYVESFKSTPYNLMTLLLTSIDEDRQELEKRLMEALKVLERQNYILKSLDTYEFLTDVERDINSEIKHEEVTDAELAKSIGSDFIFQEKLISRKFTYPKLKGRYAFSFNHYIDGVPVGATNNELSISVFTPLDVNYNQEESELRRISLNTSNPEVVVDLPADKDYITNLMQAIQIEKYMRRTHNSNPRQKQIIIGKGEERKQLIDSARASIQTALENSDIYVNGEKLDKNKDFLNALVDAQQRLVDEVYRQLPSITAAKSDGDIIALFNSTDELVDEQDNEQAVKDVLNNIISRVGLNEKISLRTVITNFSKIPYHFTDEDIEWIVAKLFTQGDIRVEVNGEKFTIGQAQDNPHNAAGYFTKRQYLDKLTFQPKKKVSAKQVKNAKELAKEILKRSARIADENSEERITEILSEEIADKIGQLQRFADRQNMPGDVYLNKGIKLYQDVLYLIRSDAFYDNIGKKLDDFYEWLDEMDDRGLVDFYLDQGKKEMWQASLNDLAKFEQNRSSLDEDTELKQIINEERELISKDNPKETLPRLHELHATFANKFNDLIDDKVKDYKKYAEDKLQSVLEFLQEASLNEQQTKELTSKIRQNFDSKNKIVSHASDEGNLSNIVLGEMGIDSLHILWMKKITDATAIERPIVVDPIDPIKPLPVKTVKSKLTYLSLKNVLPKSNMNFKSEEEIDEYLKQLGDKLKQELKSSETLTISL